eukprot:30927-Pelagococcus_subviridis.AAC.14
MRRDPSRFGLIQLPAPLVESNHLRSVQRPRRFLDELPPVLPEPGVELDVVPRDPVRERDDFRVEVVREARDKLRLDRRGVRQQRQVVREFLVLGDDDALAAGVEPWSTRSSEDLLDVEHAQVPEPAFLRVVQLRAFDDHGVRGQVDPPRQRRGADEDFHDPRGEELLHEGSIRPQHPGVVAPEALPDQLLELVVPTAVDLRLEPFFALVVLRAAKQLDAALRVRGELRELTRGLHRVLSAVHEHHRLLPALQRARALIVRDLRHQVETFHRVSLRHADEHLRQRNRSVALIEHEQPRVGDAQELRDVHWVRQRRGQTDDSDHRLRRLDLPVRPRDEGLDHRTAFVVQKVHLVDDQEAQRGRDGNFPALARDDVPLLRGRDDHRRLLELFLRELRVPGELPHRYPERGESARKRVRDLRGERLHRRDVHNLKVVPVPLPVIVEVRADLV